jgi:hypothetical protein
MKKFGFFWNNFSGLSILCVPQNHHLFFDEMNSSATRSRYFMGLLFLAIVVLLWVSSSLLTQRIFVGMNFSDPFFLTYFNTLIFIVYLVPECTRLAVFKWKRHREKRYRNLAENVEEDRNSGNFYFIF